MIERHFFCRLPQRWMSALRKGRISIATRLYLGFTVVLVLLGAVGALGWYQTSLLASQTRALVRGLFFQSANLRPVMGSALARMRASLMSEMDASALSPGRPRGAGADGSAQRSG